jgi:hypothetical protein
MLAVPNLAPFIYFVTFSLLLLNFLLKFTPSMENSGVSGAGGSSPTRRLGGVGGREFNGHNMKATNSKGPGEMNAISTKAQGSSDRELAERKALKQGYTAAKNTREESREKLKKAKTDNKKLRFLSLKTKNRLVIR